MLARRSHDQSGNHAQQQCRHPALLPRILRNVEQTDDPELFEAQGRIADVVAKDARAFFGRLMKEDSCFLLHLSEGVARRVRRIQWRADTFSPFRWRPANGRSTTG